MQRTIISVCLCVPLAWSWIAPPVVFAPTVQSETPVELLAEWPKPGNKKALDKDIQRLRKARTEEMATQAHDALSAADAGVVPLLLKAYDKERDEDARERVGEVLAIVTKPNQAKLLAAEFTHAETHVRSWLLWRTATFREARIVSEAEAALSAVQERKPERGDKSHARELYCAALCATASGSTKGLDELYEVAKKSWGEHGAEVRNALESLRPSDAHKSVSAYLQTASDREAKAAVLRLLAGCGNENTVAVVRPFLEDSDSTLRVEAINALRGIIDGDPPLDRLPVFEAIELANKWKERL